MKSRLPPATLQLELDYQPPLAWQSLVRFMAARSLPRLEQVHGDRYLRTLCLDGYSGWIDAQPVAGRAQIQVALSPALEPVLPELTRRLRHLFNLDADPQRIDSHLATQACFRDPVVQRPGLRVPGCLDGFELALRTVLGQQVSVKAATTLFGRFALRFGTPLATPFADLDLTAPRADAIAEADLQTLIDLGLTQRRAQTIKALAEAVASGTLCLHPGSDSGQTRASLLALPGIGPWTTEYIAMRALAEPDAFPGSDLALLQAMSVRRPKELLALAEAWRPWRAYAALHLWQLAAAGG